METLTTHIPLCHIRKYFYSAPLDFSLHLKLTEQIMDSSPLPQAAHFSSQVEPRILPSVSTIGIPPLVNAHHEATMNTQGGSAFTAFWLTSTQLILVRSDVAGRSPPPSKHDTQLAASLDASMWVRSSGLGAPLGYSLLLRFGPVP